ncbi:TPA: hypothetical protein IUW94_002647 [Enterococcus faecalis]|nr:hypothetical protein [Enterococcus faecalis]
MWKKKIVLSFLFYLISALGISLTIQAGIGVSSFNAFNVTFATLTHLKVGTVTTAINLAFLGTCWLLDQQRKIQDYLIILVALIGFGFVINFFLYQLFGSLVFQNYLVKIVLFILGTGQVVALGVLQFPIEKFCTLISERTRYSFQFYRYLVDIFCVSLALGLSISYHLPIFVREGTVISLFLLSWVISWSRKRGQQRILRIQIKKLESE